MEFCENCQSYLTITLNDSKNIINWCYKCNIEYPIKNHVLKTIKYEKKNDMKLESALYDNLLPAIIKKCPKCPNNILVYYKKNDMTNIYICRECKNYF